MTHPPVRPCGPAMLVLLLGLLTAGCTAAGDASARLSADGDAASTPPAAEEALPVEVAELGRGEIEASLGASANLEAESSVAVFARSDGLVNEIYAEEGHRVGRGTILVRLEDIDQRNQLAKTSGQLEKARRDYQRQQRLFAQDLISESTFSEATYEIEQLELAYADAKRMLELTEVRAPIGGTVTARHVNQGDRVGPSSLLFEIVDFNSLVARIFVPEKELSRLKSGLPARVRSQALPGRSFKGRLVRVAPIVDARSGTVKATVAIGAQPGLLPGMYVDVSLVTDTRDDALLIPKRALIYDGDRSFVYKVQESGRVERIPVVPALSNEDFVEPESGGLAAGDRVVVAGQAALKDGALVRVIGGQSAAVTTAEGAEAGS